MSSQLRMYDEARDPTGRLDPTERAAAITLCANARSKTEAVEWLAMLGLLRKERPS